MANSTFNIDNYNDTNVYYSGNYTEVTSTTLNSSGGADRYNDKYNDTPVYEESTTEKYDKYYFKYKYQIPEDHINLINLCGSEVEEGSVDNYFEIENFINNNDISILENYNYKPTLQSTVSYLSIKIRFDIISVINKILIYNIW